MIKNTMTSNASCKDNADLICIAKVIGVYGIRGEVKIHFFNTVQSQHISQYKYFILNGKNMTVKNIKHYRSNTFLVKFVDINDRNTSESIRDVELFIKKQDLPDLLEDEIYFDNLHNLEVISHGSNKVIGKVIGVFNFGAGDIIELDLPLIKESVMIPFADNWIADIDIQANKMIVNEKLVFSMLSNAKEHLMVTNDKS